MKLGIYVIRDDKTGYLSPTVDASDAAAVRNFQNAVTKTEGIINAFPQDFSLYRVGYYDSETGLIEAHEREHLADGSNFKITEV